MVAQSEKQRLKRLLSEAIVLLCKNGLPFSKHFCLEALIGVTLDKGEVVLFNVTETIDTTAGCAGESNSESVRDERESMHKDVQTRTIQNSQSTSRGDRDVILGDDDDDYTEKSLLPNETETEAGSQTIVKYTAQSSVSTKQHRASKGSSDYATNQQRGGATSNGANSRASLKRERSEVADESSYVNVKAENYASHRTCDTDTGEHGDHGGQVKLETAWSEDVRDDDGCIYVQSDEEYDEMVGNEEYAEGDENYEGIVDGEWGEVKEEQYGYDEYGEGEEGGYDDQGPSTSYDAMTVPAAVGGMRRTSKMMGGGGSGRRGRPPTKRQRIQRPQADDATDMSQVAAGILSHEIDALYTAGLDANHMGGEGPADQMLECRVCGAKLKGKHTLRDHIRGTHLSLYSFRCVDCGVAFKWRSTLKNHRVHCRRASHEQLLAGQLSLNELMPLY